MNKEKESKKAKKVDFFVLILVYAFYNCGDTPGAIVLIQATVARYLGRSVRTVKYWYKELRDLGFLDYAEREDAGQVKTYITCDEETGERIVRAYTVPKYQKIRCGKKDELRFANVYVLDQKGLNSYLAEKFGLDVLNSISEYKSIFDSFITFLANKEPIVESVEEAIENPNAAQKDKLTAAEKEWLSKSRVLAKRIAENQFYLNIKRALDIAIPAFVCRYLEEGCLRLTHEICQTVNPEHVEKFREDSFFRSSHARTDMLEEILHVPAEEIEEIDVNASIYRLTYNLYHNELLGYDIDVYELIWRECHFDISIKDKKIRNSFKKLLMPLFMKTYVLVYKAMNWDYINSYFAPYPERYNNLEKEQRECYELYKFFVDLTELPIKEFLCIVRDAMLKVLNTPKTPAADIFIHESNLHLLMRQKFLERGIIVVNVYDGFYVEKGLISQDDFYRVYSECTKELKLNLQKGIGTPLPTE